MIIFYIILPTTTSDHVRNWPTGKFAGIPMGQSASDYHTAEINIEIPVYEEMENIIKRLKNNKVPKEICTVAKRLKQY